jgi:chromosome segregation ATPase
MRPDARAASEWSRTGFPDFLRRRRDRARGKVRALRTEITERYRNTLRSQLLVARLQLQEQRIMHLDRQRAKVSSRVAATAQRRREAAATLRSMETQAGASDAQNPVAALLREFRAEIASLEAAERQIRGEEAQLLNAVSDEQARWSDFNTRLDDLERVLTQR